MPSLLRRSGFLAVLAAGAALFGAGVQGVTEVDTTLQLAAQRTDDRPLLVRYDGELRGHDCPDAPARPHRVPT
jgi:hypothetical protein